LAHSQESATLGSGEQALQAEGTVKQIAEVAMGVHTLRNRREGQAM
jgi:hypothetical protein